MTLKTTVEPGVAALSPVAQPWDDAAQGWNLHSDVIRAWLRDVTGAMLDMAGVAPGTKVLDIAAGAGEQTLDIARRAGSTGRVLAIDISPRILALAREKFIAQGILNVDTRVGDAQALGLAGAGFDAAVSRLGLMFCETPLLALQEIKRALRPGGRFSALVFSNPAANPCLAIMIRTVRQHAGLPAADPFAPGSLMSLGKPGLMQKLLMDAGFTDIKVQPVSVPFRLSSAEHYIEFVRTSGSPIMEIMKPLSGHEQAAAWEDMARQLNAYSTPDGWEGPNELLLCSATS